LLEMWIRGGAGCCGWWCLSTQSGVHEAGLVKAWYWMVQGRCVRAKRWRFGIEYHFAGWSGIDGLRDLVDDSRVSDLMSFLLVNASDTKRGLDVDKNMPLESLYRKGFSAPSGVHLSLISKSFPNYLLSSYQGLLSQQSISIRLSAQFTLLYQNTD